MSGLDFFMDGGGVGILDTDGPREPGRYSYMPYRSVSHYSMCRLLRSGESPRCYCVTEREHVAFTVKSLPEYGVLELCDIERTPRTPE
jgi:hypothetical protein